MSETKSPRVKTVLSEPAVRVFECGGHVFRTEKQEAYYPAGSGGLRGYVFWNLAKEGESPRGAFASLGEVKAAIQRQVVEGV